MKIKNIFSEQFAGVRNRDVSFDDGINVIYGKNESGKSTLVNLISRTLFQSVKLDRRTDKDFYELYFPSEKKNGSQKGDFINGKITLETENDTYLLSKEWGVDARCSLSTSDGAFRDQSKIDEILKEVLVYGEGVYSNILFSSQRNAHTALQTILDASSKNGDKQEITNAVSKAFAESDGISVEKIEQAVAEKIDYIAGKHWDFEREAPIRRNSSERWGSGLGEILRTYYAWEDAKKVLETISELEAEADRAASDYTSKDTAAKNAEEGYNKFNFFASRLAVQNERKKNIIRIKNELSKISEVLLNWHPLVGSLEKAKQLQTEKANREVLDKFGAVNLVCAELDSLKKTLPTAQPTEAELLKVTTLQRNITKLENKLCGMNITAAINMLSANNVEITSLRTGKAVEPQNGIASITEAVKITLPGIMEMQLSPADVDVIAIENQIAEYNKSILEIFEKYRVKSLPELEQLDKFITDTNSKIERAENRLALLLGSQSYSELEAAAGKVTAEIRAKESIEKDISDLCPTDDLARFITAKETVLESYIAEYGSINALEEKSAAVKTEFEKAKKDLLSLEDIPAEYLAVSDPDKHLSSLQSDLKFKQDLREEAMNKKTAALSRLQTYKNNVEGDPVANAENTERIFEQQKELLKHWLHIAEVLKAQKEKLHDNPMQDIADRFAYYLGIISDGKVSTEFPEADKLNMNIYSANNRLDYEMLSKGTSQIVFLAFRLAVLDHLFPQGGGVIVFDDPFTDMDADRTARSCELIKECAKRHQVIFLTCNEAYLDLLQGNRIMF